MLLLIGFYLLPARVYKRRIQLLIWVHWDTFDTFNKCLFFFVSILESLRNRKQFIIFRLCRHHRIDTTHIFTMCYYSFRIFFFFIIFFCPSSKNISTKKKTRRYFDTNRLQLRSIIKTFLRSSQYHCQKKTQI